MLLELEYFTEHLPEEGIQNICFLRKQSGQAIAAGPFISLAIVQTYRE